MISARFGRAGPASQQQQSKSVCAFFQKAARFSYPNGFFSYCHIIFAI
jgi:hypothetical protein